jgi:Domain of unknown function (DU1801)
MQSKATTVAQYLKDLPADRRQAIEAVRKVILKNMDPGFQEGIQYGMIGYSVPHSIYAEGYHCDPKQPLPFAALASQKNHMSLYFNAAYGDADAEAWLREAWAKAGKKLDMGKSCIRFKKLDDLPLDVVGQAFKRIRLPEYVRRYEKFRDQYFGSKKAKTPVVKAPASPGKAAVKKSVGQQLAVKKSAPAGKKIAPKTSAIPSTTTTATSPAKLRSAKKAARSVASSSRKK